MAEGAARRLGRLTGQGDDLAPLLSTEGGGGSGAWGVLSTRCHRLLGTRQPVAAPQPHRSPAGPQAVRYLGRVMAVGQQEDNMGTETVVLRRGMGSYQPEEFLAFSLR